MTGDRRLSSSERVRRDARVFAMFSEGASYRDIGEAVGLRSVSGVHRIVQRELAAGASRRDVLTDDAFAVWLERQESLLRAHWDRATREDPDHKSAELVRKVLANQAKVFSLGQDLGQPLPAATAALPDQDDDEPENELDRLRAKRNQTGAS